VALTTLDPKTALVVIDLQKGIVALPAAEVAANVVKHASILADAFRGAKMPVVLVNVAGSAPGRTERVLSLSELPPDWAELVAELNRQPDDHTVTKKTWGAFTNTGLDAYLKQQGVTQIVLAGVATSIGVESTARFAYELGFNIAFAIDAMADLNPDAHANSISRIFPRLGETGTTQEIIELLKHTHA
jgi:nicotinamidase-related amidase